MPDEPRHKERGQTYQADGITVRWEPRLCIHTGFCFKTLGSVFQPWDTPWVKPERADAERIAAAVRLCPTGALQYETPEGPEPAPVEGLEVTVIPNGPLFLRGSFQLQLDDGTVVRRANRAALCRCGQSKNKPFCDNTHLEARFRAD